MLKEKGNYYELLLIGSENEEDELVSWLVS
jgi:hypothetical protein